RDAPVVVMTTEVFRNMLYAGSRSGRPVAAEDGRRKGRGHVESGASGARASGRRRDPSSLESGASRRREIPAPGSAGLHSSELGRVDFVVLDECHYINDVGRGTV